MKLELFIIAVTAFFIYNTYHDGKYLKMILSYKKHIQIGFYLFLAIGFYLIIKRNPAKSKDMLAQANNMIKYMPIDRSSMMMLSPIIDLTTSNSGLDDHEFNYQFGGAQTSGERRMMQSGNKTVKRSVSETKKKYVASMQNWKCGNCKKQLNHVFEIDHHIALQNGGSNDVSNLIALCPMCHREKTAFENMNK
jgi:rubredoxin